MIIKVKVHPTSGRQEITKKSKDEFEVYLKSKTENNKANIELIKILKKYFGKEVKIKSGKTSRRKIIELN
ncbi:MAG: DUF167 domain-containing protein [Nanoarchaeota archaeon]|nr:DUF167 domain-containing protein [Nanoarchaeota archaeon]